LQDVAKALRVPYEYVLRFISAELGTINEVIKDPKSLKVKALVNGAHNYSKILELIDKFIAKYVLCPKCHIPEIVMKVKKKDITCKCYSCGHKG